jgi:PHD/YefM family antitoxin component YafN of YafNO toxin-antitoxin module
MNSVTIKGEKPLVVISVDEYESMKETIELLSADPDLAQELEEERRGISKGRSITWAEFKKKYKIR